jgi:transcription antitermination factor NusG
MCQVYIFNTEIHDNVNVSKLLEGLVNTTFNNISVISWQFVLLVEETKVLDKTTDKSLSNKFVIVQMMLSLDVYTQNFCLE